MSSPDALIQLQFTSKGIDASDALRQRVEQRLEDATAKYFQRPGEAFVTVAREGHGFKADVSMHLPSGALLQAHGFNADAYAAAESALERLEKRLRRYKRRLTDHRSAQPRAETPLVVLQGAVPDVDDPDYDAEPDATAHGGADAFEPVVVAETTAELPVMTVGLAVQEMDASQSPWLIFRNAAHDGVNVVYRRPDGHIGWIDPGRGAARNGAG